MVQRRAGILECIEWLRVRVPGIALALCIAGLFLLQVPAVGKQEAAEFGGGRRAMDMALEAVSDQRGQIAGMVEMGVCEKDTVY